MAKLAHGAHRESCRFYDDGANTGPAQSAAGLCRYNPPVTQPNPDGRGLWPVASAHDWCGHFTSTSVDAAE